MTPSSRSPRLTVAATLAFIAVIASVVITAAHADGAAFMPSAPEIEMVFVEGGTLKRSAARGLTVANGFYIGKYEITQKQWVQVMGKNPSPRQGDSLPVENVSLGDVNEFIARLNGLTGKNYRLPTGAEWEYAARGGNKSMGYAYSGGNNATDVAWYCKNSGDRYHGDLKCDPFSDDRGRVAGNNNGARPVGTKKPNELGIHDMSGNVREWIGDWRYTGHSNKARTWLSISQSARGGGWDSDDPRIDDWSEMSTDMTPEPSPVVGLRLVLVNQSGQRDSLNVEMVFIKGGTFECAPDDDCDGGGVLDDFYISRYQVTQALWKTVMGKDNNPSFFIGDDLPVDHASGDDIGEFVGKLRELTGKKYRTATDAEWDYATCGDAGTKPTGRREGANCVGGGDDKRRGSVLRNVGVGTYPYRYFYQGFRLVVSPDAHHENTEPK